MKVLLLACAFLAMAAATPDFKQWPNLLEVSTRPWLYEMTQQYGYLISLSNVPDAELDAIQADGITALYALGMWSLGPYGLAHDRTDPGLLSSYAQTLPDYTVDDIIGSCFAVTSYTINPEIGTEDDLVTFRQRLHSRGIALYLDFVPNHSAVDSVHMSEHNEYFIHAPKGQTSPYDPSTYLPDGTAFGKDKYGNVWTDTAQYNYWDTMTYHARIMELQTVASFADGIRCDMAMLALNSQIADIWSYTLTTWGYTAPEEEFWSAAIRAVKQVYPDTIFMAEVYWGLGQDLLDTGFDYVYDKEGLYDTLSGEYLDNIRNYIKYTSYDYLSHGTHFIENHDEGRAVEHFGSVPVADAAGLITFTLPGMKFHFQGQWVGKRNKLDVHLRRSYAEADSTEAEDLYGALLPMLNDDVWHLGTYTYDDVWGTDDCWRLMSWRYEYNGVKVVVIANFSDQSGSGRVSVPNAGNGSDSIVITEKLSGAEYTRSASDMRDNGLFVIVDAWDAQIFYYP
ncbi:glycoside hydrolase, family 13 [Kipferlia bialata]|uniref:Glycoside hydrolase, family 13 n=1 Tax=Kipferlia bialata TaxID=797122 RepID=A0A9K3CV82_9EUKA|nr:glycoside hydrolase, family 13 [Kipferlia bialata]|eukprot:g4292.t1